MNLIEEIKEKARVFVKDNYKNHTERDYLLIQSAMLIGANLEMDRERINFIMESFCCSETEAKEMIKNRK